MMKKDQPQRFAAAEVSNPTNGCDCQGDLMSYLYDEASAAERANFESHLTGCGACRDELAGFRQVRDDLGVWQVGFAPRTEIAISRSSLEIFRELLGQLPFWVRTSGVAVATAAALLLVFALAGTRVDLRNGTISFGLSTRTEPANISAPVAASRDSKDTNSRAISPQLTSADIERMIAERVKALRADDAQEAAEIRAQVANLSMRLASANQSQARLSATINDLRAEQRAMLARGQSTLGEWLFASNGTREARSGDNEKDN
jgi:hypothetical protein